MIDDGLHRLPVFTGGALLSWNNSLISSMGGMMALTDSFPHAHVVVYWEDVLEWGTITKREMERTDNNHTFHWGWCQAPQRVASHDRILVGPQSYALEQCAWEKIGGDMMITLSCLCQITPDSIKEPFVRDDATTCGYCVTRQTPGWRSPSWPGRLVHHEQVQE